MSIKDRTISILLYIIIIHSFLITKLIFFPYPEFFVYPYLTNQGLKPYSQILDQHFPGLMFLPLNLDNLGMNNEFNARIWLVGIIVLTHIFIYLISVKIFKDKNKALLANIFYMVWQPYLEGWMLWIDNFMPLFLLPAFYFSYMAVSKERLYRLDLLLSGFFLSVAILFKQMAIPLAGLIFIYLIFYKRRFSELIPFFLGFIPVSLYTGIYLYNLGVLKDFWYWTVTFNLTTFAEHGRKPAFFTGLVRIAFIYSVVLFSYISDQKKLIIALLIFIIGGLSGDIARFDFVHFQTSLPFLSILFAEVSTKILKFGYGRVYLLIFLVVSLFWNAIFYKGHISDSVYFFDSNTKEVIAKIKDYTDPGDEIFLYGVSPHIYQQSQTLPAGKIFVFQFPWFLMESEDRFVQVLTNNPPKLIVSNPGLEIEGWKLKDYAKKIDRIIIEKYEKFEEIGGVEFLKIKDGQKDQSRF